MILGMSIADLTLLHTIISLVGIASGILALLAMAGNRRAAGWTALFLLTTVATSVTGFLFPIAAIGPPHIVGAISLVVLLLALWSRYGRRLSGSARPIYIVTAVAALFLNCFVGVAQAFQKIPLLQTLAPTQSEPPFLIAQAAVLGVLVILGLVALLRFRPN